MIYIIQNNDCTSIVDKYEFEVNLRYCKYHNINWVINRYKNISRELIIVERGAVKWIQNY